MFASRWILAAILIISTEAVPGNVTKPLYHEKSKQTFSISKKYALFGYSIAYQSTLTSLIVGCPRASIVGEVYSCSTKETVNTTCQKVPIDETTFRKIERYVSDNKFTADHYYQWLGATVNAGSNFYMTCAPRFMSRSDDKRQKTTGRCLYEETASHGARINMATMSRVQESEKKEYHKAAYPGANDTAISLELLMDSFGWSSHVADDSIVVGGPAMSIGRAMLLTDVKSSANLFTIDNAKLQKNNKNVAFNFGYSITSGYFFVDPEVKVYAISTPYGSIGKGRVLFFEDHQTMKEEILEDDEVGSLFGAALGSLAKEDGLSALLVGAPAYDSFAATIDSQTYSYDTGAVYLYDYVEDNFVLKRKIIGYESGSYFGSAIATIGDLDGDKTDEVAISAPYENSGSGAVYLYSGKQMLDKSPELKYKQKLKPEGGPGQYFGLALSPLADTDGNGCNELAIGAPGADYVTLYRCITSVSVTFTATFPDLKKQSQELSKSASSFSFDPCLNVKYPEKPTAIETKIIISIEIVHPNVTIAGANKGVLTYNADLASGRPQYCKTVTVILPQEADYDHDIVFNMTAALAQNPLELTKFNPRLVLLDNTTNHTQRFTAPPLPGSDMTLDVYTSLKDGYLIGSSENETLTMVLVNAGNTAFGACVRVRLTGIKVSQWPEHICSVSGQLLTCSPPTALRRSKSWNVTVSLATKSLTNSDEKVKLYAELLTGCQKKTGNAYEETFNFKIDSKFAIKSISSPSRLVNVTRKELSLKDGKHIEHIYKIINIGVTNWEKVSCDVTVPLGIARVTAGLTDCKLNGTNAHCIIKKIHRNAPVNVKVQMDISPDHPIIDKIKKGQAPLDTELSLRLGNETKKASITTIITLWEDPKVPLWIIIVAALVGLVLVLVLGWALYECGCFRRENKEKLDELKRDVKRQSMRRSMMLRQSTIEVVTNEQGDRQRLVDVPEEDDSISIAEVLEDTPRAALAAELEKKLAKGDKQGHTKAEVHKF
ncbi:integrin alpha-PS3-like [Pectinophora gossypiella]|uniref:integrin alpha-PS3-like n=1 Tax=Pectinophora gossypiella TaxID=13191 RepID=UPI00214E4293|nr:integrin alpha-PS3-like [Pectinophora gossypiella]